MPGPLLGMKGGRSHSVEMRGWVRHWHRWVRWGTSSGESILGKEQEVGPYEPPPGACSTISSTSLTKIKVKYKIINNLKIVTMDWSIKSQACSTALATVQQTGLSPSCSCATACRPFLQIGCPHLLAAAWAHPLLEGRPFSPSATFSTQLKCHFLQCLSCTLTEPFSLSTFYQSCVLYRPDFFSWSILK